jgi:hypothetical protein
MAAGLPATKVHKMCGRLPEDFRNGIVPHVCGVAVVARLPKDQGSLNDHRSDAATRKSYFFTPALTGG